MAEKKDCIHCSRSIDAAARVCPYCNREQDVARVAEARPTIPLPPIEVAPAAARPSLVRSVRSQWGMRALVIAAVVGLLMASFAIGGLVYGIGKRGDNKADKKEEQPIQVAENSSRSEFPQLTLVAENDPTSSIGRSITSAPIPDPDHKVPSEFQRSDATALPSTEYSKLLEQNKKAAQPAPQQIASADPRVLTAQQPPAHAAAPTPPPRNRTAVEPETEREREPREPARPRETSPEPRSEQERLRDRVVRTDPVPLSQPLPQGINEDGQMRFRLTVGADGRVKEVRVLETMPGMTGRMIASIQRWKFRPATENGIPVDGTFMVDVSFNASE
jgi:hypothetical protein